MADDDFSNFDLSKLFPQVPGLLSDQDKKAATAQALMGLSAGLLKAGGTPSPVRGGSWGRGLGEGVEGLLSGYNNAQNSALKNQLVRGQLTTQQMAIMQKIAEFQALGLPVPPQMQQLASQIMGPGSGPGASAAQLAPTVPSVPNAPGSGASPASVGPPGTPTGTAAPRVPNGTDATPGVSSSPAAPGAPLAGASPGGVQTIVQYAQAHGIDPRSLMIPEIRKAVGEMMAKNSEMTPEMKNAAASGYPNPEAFERAKTANAEDQKMASGAFSQAQAGQTLRNMAVRTQAILQNPNIASAPGFDIKDVANRFKVLFGVDPGAMSPTEQVQMMASQEMLKTMQEVANSYEASGEKAPRWFQSMVEEVKGTLADPRKFSLPTIQIAMERMRREGDRDYQIGREMLDFQDSHGGKLGPAWRKRMLDLRNDDVFNKDEREALGGRAAPPPGSNLPDIRSPETKPTFSTPTGGSSMPIPVPQAAAPGAAPPQPSPFKEYPDARQSPRDGHWYVMKNGSAYRVDH